MRVLVRQQPVPSCAPCIKAWTNFKAFNAELQQTANDLSNFALGTYSAEEYTDNLETMQSAVTQLEGCLDERLLRAKEALFALPEKPPGPEGDPGEILLAVDELSRTDGADLIAQRCCR